MDEVTADWTEEFFAYPLGIYHAVCANPHPTFYSRRPSESAMMKTVCRRLDSPLQCSADEEHLLTTGPGMTAHPVVSYDTEHITRYACNRLHALWWSQLSEHGVKEDYT